MYTHTHTHTLKNSGQLMEETEEVSRSWGQSMTLRPGHHLAPSFAGTSAKEILYTWCSSLSSEMVVCVLKSSCFKLLSTESNCLGGSYRLQGTGSPQRLEQQTIPFAYRAKNGFRRRYKALIFFPHSHRCSSSVLKAKIAYFIL